MHVDEGACRPICQFDIDSGHWTGSRIHLIPQLRRLLNDGCLSGQAGDQTGILEKS